LAGNGNPYFSKKIAVLSKIFTKNFAGMKTWRIFALAIPKRIAIERQNWCGSSAG
jgi:hypothetical protein